MIVILIYLTGCIIGYILFKKSIIKRFTIWTIWDRHIGLFFSIFSWALVVPMLFVFYFSSVHNDKPASW